MEEWWFGVTDIMPCGVACRRRQLGRYEKDEDETTDDSLLQVSHCALDGINRLVAQSH